MLRATVLTLVCMAAIAGCEREHYDIAVMNKSGETVEGVSVAGAPTPVSMGGISNNGYRSFSSFFAHPPPSLTLSWNNSSGRHSQEVLLSGLIPERFEDVIFFKICPRDQVKVTTMRLGDVEAFKKFYDEP